MLLRSKISNRLGDERVTIFFGADAFQCERDEAEGQKTDHAHNAGADQADHPELQRDRLVRRAQTVECVKLRDQFISRVFEQKTVERDVQQPVTVN